VAIGIDPLIDYAFKMLFGSDDHKSLTIHFLNSVLVGQPPVTEITFQNPIRYRHTADGKVCILDVLAIDALGRQLNIEVQISLPAGMAKRMVYYSAQTYVRQLLEGQSYNSLQPAICICVLAGALYSQPAELHLDFRLREKSHPLTLTDDLQIHFLQLNHLQVTEETVYHASPVERWAWFLRHAEGLTSDQVARLFPDEEFSEAAEVLEMIAQTPQHLVEYNARLKAQRDEEARILYAQQQGKAEGLAEGLAEGIDIGRRQGIDIGVEKGVLIGQIALLQKFLRQPVWPEQQFQHYGVDQLRDMATDLQQKFDAQHS